MFPASAAGAVFEQVNPFQQGFQGLFEFLGRMVLGQFGLQALQPWILTEVGAGFAVRISLLDRAEVGALSGHLEQQMAEQEAREGSIGPDTAGVGEPAFVQGGRERTPSTAGSAAGDAPMAPRAAEWRPT